MSNLSTGKPKSRPSAYLVGILCVLLVPFLIYGVIVIPQLLTNSSISRSFESVQLPSSLTQTKKDCGVHDFLDVGPVCYYDYAVKTNVTRTQLRSALTEKLGKAGCSTPAPGDYFYKCSTKHISIHIDLLPDSDPRTLDFETQIDKAIISVTKS